jgi:signal recognition particle subunit SRP54
MIGMDLGKKLREALSKLSNKPYIDEDDVKALIKDLQRVLISSDVNVKLVFALSKRIEERALKSEKMSALTLKEHVMKVVYDELTILMGETYSPKLEKHRILVCGLYGSGKTTTCAKLAQFYKSKGLSVALIAADTDRPAAKEQLEQLAKQVGVKFYTNKEETSSPKIVEQTLKNAKEDIIIVDSAGRNAIDENLSEELKKIHQMLNPQETYLVISGDIGQIASKQATEFSNAIPITGVIVTKMDGSGKGGGALSAVASTQSKISFIGVGEKINDFEIYNSQKFVGRLLGVPDFEGLLEKIKAIAEENKAKELQEQNQELTIETFYEQLKNMKKLGPIGNVFSMIGAADVPKEVVRESEGKLGKFEAMINSMSKKEKKEAKLLKNNPSRIARIAKGSGTSEKDVKDFLAQFEKMEKMMNMFKSNRGFRKKMERMMKGAPPGLGGLTG